MKSELDVRAGRDATLIIALREVSGDGPFSGPAFVKLKMPCPICDTLMGTLCGRYAALGTTEPICSRFVLVCQACDYVVKIQRDDASA
jgi:hypothetical protein